MEFRQLRYFIAVAEEGSVTAATLRLHVSQPPITRQIHSLEHEIGVELFSRTSKGVTLTQAGEVFLSQAKRLVELSESAAQKCKEAASGELGRLDVGYFGSTVYTLVPEFVRRFRMHAPKVSVRISRASKDDQIMQLRDGRLGIGFARHYAIEPDLETLCVAQEPLFVAMGGDGKGVKGSPQIGWRDALAERRLILFPQIGRPSFADEVLKLVRVLEVESPQIDVAEDVFAALALVQIVDAVSIVPESVAKLHWGRLNFMKIGHPSAFSPVSCVFLRRDRPAVVDAFLSILTPAAKL